jgi:hypothetical protein
MDAPKERSNQAREGEREREREKRVKHTLLQQHHPREPIIQIPKIHTRHTPLVVQLPIHIERLVRANLHLPHPLTRHRALACTLVTPRTDTAQPTLIERRVELVRPRAAVAVAVTVVVAYEVVAAGLLAAADLEGLVDGGEEVFGEVGGELDEAVEMGGCVFGVESAEEVAVGLVRCCTVGG